jgi:CDGSH-type Zn-finger protein
MSEPVVAKKHPMSILVEEGKTYFWCSCGRSQNQPFCDGSHKDTDFTPVKYEARLGARASFCACKRTSSPPLCDSTHLTLE